MMGKELILIQEKSIKMWFNYRPNKYLEQKNITTKEINKGKAYTKLLSSDSTSL